ncbi:MAG: WD40 repeat domain-containing protein [Bacteroidia bacterium]
MEITKLASFTGHSGSIFAMTTNEKEEFLYTSGDDGIVAKWQIEQPELDAVGLLRSAEPIYALCWLEKQQQLVMGLSDGTVHFFEVSQKKILHSFRKITQAVYSLLYDARHDYLWILYGGGFLSVWDCGAQKEVYFHQLSKEHLRSIVIWENNLLIGASDGNIYVLHRENFQVLYVWKAHESSVFSLSVLSEKQILLSGGRDAHLNVWDLKEIFQNVVKIPAHNFTINDIAISPDERYFLTASRDKTLKLWDSSNFQLIKVIDFARNEGHLHSVNKIKWLSKKKCVISCSDDKRVLMWEINI